MQSTHATIFIIIFALYDNPKIIRLGYLSRTFSFSTMDIKKICG